MMLTNDEINRRLLLQEEYLGADKPVNKIAPVLSVRVNTYQHAKYIRQCLDSILEQQTEYPYEIIIGEDGSTDGTREICIEYAEAHQDRIRLFLRDRKITAFYDESGNFKKSINGILTYKSSVGKYVANCEGDDYWTDPHKIQKQIEFMEGNPDYAICFHNAKVVDETNGKEYLLCRPEQKEVTAIEDILICNYIPTASVLFMNYRNLQDMPDEFYNLPIGDWPSRILTAQYGRIKYFPDVMSVYRLHGNSAWSSKKWSYHMISIIKVYKTLNIYFKNRYEELINKKIYDELTWRFKLLIDSFEEYKYEEALSYANDLCEVLPLNYDARLGKIVSLFKLGRITETADELSALHNIDEKDKMISDIYAKAGIILPEYFKNEKTFLKNAIGDIIKEIDAMDKSGDYLKYSLIKFLSTHKPMEGNQYQPEMWNVDYQGERARGIFAHANSRLYFNVPFPHAGKFRFGIMMHPDIWQKEEAAGGTSFVTVVDDRVSFEFVLDPVSLERDRRRYDFELDIPYNEAGNHEVLLETKTLGENNYSRWALWVEPEFIFEGVSGEEETKEEGVQAAGQKWSNGIDYEIRFWEDWLATKGGRWPGSLERRCDPGTSLQDYIIKVLPENKDEINILDVGSGPLTSLGKKAEGKKINITAVDPLAVEYNRAIDRCGVNPPVRTQYARAEELTDYVTPGSFDLVYARNSIDHSENPLIALQQMILAAKDEGVIMLEHAVNEAENGNYEGFHQWNFTSENGRFIIWNKQSRTDVGELLKGAASVETEVNKEATWIKVYIKKNKMRG